MKRAVLSVKNPQDHINDLTDYSIMIVNPDATEARRKYLLENSDYSLLITDQETVFRSGQDYANERVLWYTSGTTGDSKFCSFTQNQIDILATNICRAYDITANDRYVSIMPLWHAHGQGMFWAAQLAKCETHYITVKEIKTMPDYNPTFITAIPDLLNVIGQLSFDSLRFIRSASSALSNDLYQNLKAQHQVPVIESFGMTEALSHCFTNPLHGEQRMGTVGLPDGVEADVVDGQLYIKGPTMVCSDWYNTGDLAEIDKCGYYKILGRYRDQINVRGSKLNPISLENQLKATIPNIGDCVVFGDTGVKCLYTGNCNPTTIKEFLNKLGAHCTPRLLKKIETIPLSPAGKISRTWLNERY
jgi:acyl-coenzyme A synthetase/AMP-(fatty) acid ligase